VTGTDERGEQGAQSDRSADGGAGERTEQEDDAGRFDPDPERVRLLRETADDLRGESSESQQLAALLYRVSDLYDDGEERTPESIYRNVRDIVQVRERGGLDR
jgi:hypothetical protein